MCAELPLGNLNPDPYPSYPTNTYTCEVITTLRVHSDVFFFLICAQIDFIFKKLYKNII